MEAEVKSLGQVGYEAYAIQQSWKSYEGHGIPEWFHVRDDIKKAWEIAAKSITDEKYERDLRAYNDALRVITSLKMRNVYGGGK